MGTILDGYPTWSQNADPRSDGTQDPFAATDCGEECCAIVQMGQMMQYRTESQVRDLMPGHTDHGETTAADIAAYLETVGLYPLALQRSATSMKAFLKGAIDRGSPCIVLGHFLSPNVLHWVVVIGYGDDHVLFIDPWYGRLDAKHWRPFLGLCEGDVVMSRTRSQAT